MNKNLKALPLLVIFFSSLNVFDAVAADFPILNAACRWAKKENNGATLAGVLVTSFLAHQYYSFFY